MLLRSTFILFSGSPVADEAGHTTHTDHLGVCFALLCLSVSLISKNETRFTVLYFFPPNDGV